MKHALDDLAIAFNAIRIYSNKSFGLEEVAISNHLNLKDNYAFKI